MKNNWKDVLETFYAENDEKIHEWSDKRRLILEYHKWLEAKYNFPSIIKNNWDREEVINLLKSFFNDVLFSSNFDENKWIENNLPKI